MAKVLLISCLAVGCGLALSHFKQTQSPAHSAVVELSLTTDTCADLPAPAPATAHPHPPTAPSDSLLSNVPPWPQHLQTLGQQLLQWLWARLGF